jgi:hypothetical protein
MISSIERWVWIVTCFSETFEIGMFPVLIIGAISYLFYRVKESSFYMLGTYSRPEPVIVRGCNQKWTVQTHLPKNVPYKYVTYLCPVTNGLFHIDGQMDMTKQIVAFSKLFCQWN